MSAIAKITTPKVAALTASQSDDIQLVVSRRARELGFSPDQTDRIVSMGLDAIDRLLAGHGVAALSCVRTAEEALAAERIELGPLVIEYGIVSCFDRAYYVASAMLKLLQMLARAGGRLVPKASLIEEFCTMQKVSVYVSRLRKEIPALRDAIQVVWGQGYRLCIEEARR